MPNTLVISNTLIPVDSFNRINLNALHRASGSSSNKRPSNWLRTSTTKELVAELDQSSDMSFGSIAKNRGGNNRSSTFAHELLAISYAGWISPKFQLQVNQAFLDSKRQSPTALPAPVDDDKIRIDKDKYIALLESQVALLTPRKRNPLTDKEKDLIESMYGQWSVREIAKQLGRNPSSIYNHLRTLGVAYE